MTTGIRILDAFTLGLAATCVAVFSVSSVLADPVTVNNHDFASGGFPVVTDWDSDNNSGVNGAMPFGNALWINGVGVALIGGGGVQVRLDNVRLDAAAPPATPGTLIYGK